MSGYNWTFNEYADDVIGEELFASDEMLEIFNDSGSFGRDALDAAIGGIMLAGMRAMRIEAEERAPKLAMMLCEWSAEHIMWACPNEECSGLYQEHPSYLVGGLEDGLWVLECPKCGCSTSNPSEDLCIKEVV